MNATSLLGFTAALAVPVVLFGLLMVAPVDSEAATPSNSPSAAVRKTAQKKKAAAQNHRARTTKAIWARPRKSTNITIGTTSTRNITARAKAPIPALAPTWPASAKMRPIFQRDEQALHHDKNRLRRVLR